MSAPWLDDGDVQLYHGSALDVLRSLPAASVQTCVTSPPYWGLRDYGTGSWTGGESECDHKQDIGARASSGLNGSLAHKSGEVFVPYGDVCGRCGARRVDAQLGLEATPSEYVAALVAVFAEVWRVLRADGTLWLNLGSSYYSDPAKGGSGTPNGRNGRGESYGRAALRDARPDGNSNTEPQGSPDPGSACRDFCDGCATALERHTRHHNADTRQPDRGSASLAAPTSRDSALPGSAATSLGVWPLDVPASTTPRSSQLPPGECSHCANCDACLAVLASSSRDAGLCVRTAGRMGGTSSMSPSLAARNGGMESSGSAWLKYTSRLKPKDMIPTPWLVAMALQEWGWYLRSDIIWSKPNPMPESVTDRPTKAHEYVFLLAKQPRYYWDADAVREPLNWDSLRPSKTPHAGADIGNNHPGWNGTKTGVYDHDWKSNPAGRNARSVWTIATQPTPEAHFATFPEALVRRCILAGTSEAGGCAKCGAPWQRQTEQAGSVRDRWSATNGHAREIGGTHTERTHRRVMATSGWAASCACGAPAVPQTILDPFVGSGTTALVARKHGRRAIGVDLSSDYLGIAARRLGQQSLFATSEGAA